MAGVSGVVPVPARVFLSHSSVDTAAARAFAETLRRAGVDVWFDQDSLQPGDPWMLTVEKAVSQSSAMVVYVGPSGVQNWVDREVRYGLELNTRDQQQFKIIPVFGDGADVGSLPPFLSQHQGISVNDPAAIRRLLALLHGQGLPAVPSEYWATHSPFRSLQSFEPDDAWLFFGRDHETSELLNRLRRSRVLVVIGNSGSGKSSLVRAGLIPALRRGRLQIEGRASEHWRVAIFRPGSDPFRELVDRLASQLAPELAPADRDALITRWRETFVRGGDALRNGIAALPMQQARTLLFADQFEELFTLVTDSAVRQQYIDALLKAADADGVYLIVGLRADFYGNCLQHPPLTTFLQRNYSVSLIQATQLRESIERRLALASARAEDGLIDALLADVGTEPGNLALLEHALAQLWEPQGGRLHTRPLTNRRYEEIGRLKGAIGNHAKAVYANLTPEQQLLARRVFLELVHLGEGGQDTRRRVTKDQLLVLATPDTSARLLDLLASKRLLATSGGETTNEPAFIEVSHEALIREWDEFRKWVAHDREELRLARRLAVDAKDWEERRRDPSALLRGARLLEAEEWLEKHAEAAERVRTFVGASREQEKDEHARNLDQERQLREAADARANAERNSREQGYRRAQMVWRFAWAMVVVALVALFGALYVYRQQRIAESRQLAAEAQELRIRDQPAALVLALKAWDIAKTAEAHLAIAATFAGAPTMLKGHRDKVQSAAFSPDGQRIVTASADGTALVWNAHTGQGVARLVGHTSNVLNAAFSPDGQRVVTASLDGTARVWNAQTGQEVARLEHTSNVLNAAFSPDGERIVTASADGTARVWNAHTGQGIARLVGHTSNVLKVAFSPDGQRVVTASLDGTARVWNAQTGQVVATLQGHLSTVWSAAFSPDGQRIVTASQDKTARVWNAQTGQMVAALEGHTDILWSAAFSPDGLQIVTASQDKTARVWNAQTGQVVVALHGHRGFVHTAAFTPDGQRIVTASEDQTARVWNTHTGQVLATLQGHTNGVSSAAFSPDGERVITASDSAARVWNMQTALLIATLQGHTDAVRSAVFSPDGQRIVTASDDKTARVWNARTGQLIAMLLGHMEILWSATFSPDGLQIVTASQDMTARVWNAQTGQEVARLQGVDVTSAEFSPDGQRVVTATLGSTALVWNAHTGQVLATLQGHTNAVSSAAFSPDGQRIVTASHDKTALVWNAQTGQVVATLRGHTGMVWSAAFSPDGQRIVTASYDGTARVWNAHTGQGLATLQGHTNSVSSAAFSPDGLRIVTASQDNTARVWKAQNGEIVAILQGHTEGVLSAAFSSDGQRILTASWDRTARVYRIQTVEDVIAMLAQ